MNLIKFPWNIVSLSWYLSNAKIGSFPNASCFVPGGPKVWALIPLRETAAERKGVKESPGTQ